MGTIVVLAILAWFFFVWSNKSVKEQQEAVKQSWLTGRAIFGFGYLVLFVAGIIWLGQKIGIW
jgi:hypothetical protein